MNGSASRNADKPRLLLEALHPLAMQGSLTFIIRPVFRQDKYLVRSRPRQHSEDPWHNQDAMVGGTYAFTRRDRAPVGSTIGRREVDIVQLIAEPGDLLLETL